MPRLAPALALAALLAVLLPAGAVAAGRCGDHPWCDTSLSADQRAGLLLAQMTLDEKLELMGGDDSTGVLNPPFGQPHTGTSNGIPRLGIPTTYFSDGPVGSRQGKATPLPSAIGLAASFDPALARRHGAVIGNEAKLKGNDFVFAPTVNIMRTPLGGRTFEGYGEDPFLTSRIAVGWLGGLQGEGVVGNVKHYAANNQEGSRTQPGSNRFVVDARVDERTLREIYLPAFEAAVKEADVGTVMAAYNALNGSPATENRHLLLDVLKGDWGFKGFVLTDYEAQRSTVNAANNGLELELPQAQYFRPELLRAAIAARQIGEDVIDEHLRRILRTYFAYGLMDRDAHPNDDALIDKAAHDRETAAIEEGSIVLLRNEGSLLPVDPATVRSIAVIGPDGERYRSGGGSSNISPFTPPTTPCAGLRARGEAAGIAVTCETSPDAGAATAAAKAADLAVVVASDNQTEFIDKACLDLQDRCDGNSAGDQDGRIAAVAAANPRTVVLLETGGPVLTPWWESVGAVVEAWYPGQEGGTAIARVLFGDADPGGRLPVTFPKRAEDIPTAGDPEAYPGTGTTVTYKEGVLVGYRHYDERGIEPRAPFGHGLSYTSFAYRNLRIRPRDARGTDVTVTADVRNTGTRAGVAVPQLYLGLPDPGAGVAQPPRALKGIAKLTLAPGASQRVEFVLDERSFSYWDVGADDWALAPGCVDVSVGRSSRDLPLSGRLSLGGADCGAGAARAGEESACAATAGFARARVRARARALRITGRPRGGARRPVADVFRVSAGRRVLREHRVARVRLRGGRAALRARRLPRGVFFVRLRTRAANGRADVRRFTFERRGGRLRARPDHYRRASCGALPSFKLERPVFGGTNFVPLRIALRVRDRSRVGVRVTRGRATVRRFAARTVRPGRTLRLLVPAARTARGDHRVRVTVRPRSGGRVTAVLTSRRL